LKVQKITEVKQENMNGMEEGYVTEGERGERE
jgi:hypothetical protein